MAGGNGGASAKIYIEAALVDNFKQISGTLKNGLGKSLKELQDMDLKFGFDSEEMAQAASSELEAVTEMLSSSKYNKLDFSGIIPSLTSALSDNSLKDNVKLQVVQGLREGMQSFGNIATADEISFLQHAKGREGVEGLWGAIYGSMSVDDIIDSFGIDDKSKDQLRKTYGKATKYFLQRNPTEGVKSIAQLRSLKEASNQGYDDILKYLVSPNQAEARLKESLDFEKLTDQFISKGKIKLSNEQMADFVGYMSRLQDLASLKVPDAEAALESLNALDILKPIQQKIKDETLLQDVFKNMRQRVVEGGQIKDAMYAQITDPKVFSDYVNQFFGAFNILTEVLGDKSNARKMIPLITGDYKKVKTVSAEKLLADTMSMQSKKEGNLGSSDSEAAEVAEKAADRAEKAAETAEKAAEIAEKATDKLDETAPDEKDEKPQTNAQKAVEKASEADNSASKAGNAINAKKTNWEKQLQQDEKALKKAQEKQNELKREFASLTAEKEALDIEVNNQLQTYRNKASETNTLNDKHNAQKKDITQRNKDQETLNKRINKNSEEVQNIDDRIKTIRQQKEQLKKEYEEYKKQSQKLLEQENLTNIGDAEARRDTISDAMATNAEKATNIRDEIASLKQIKDAKTDVTGEDALQLLQEKANQTKENKTKLEQARKDLENATDDNRNELTSAVEQANQQYTRSKIELLRGFRNAQKEGVEESELTTLLSNGSEEYGLSNRFANVIKEGQETDSKQLQDALQSELESVLRPIRETIKKRQAELDKISEEVKQQQSQLQSLSAITSANNKASASKKKMDALDTEEGGLQSQKKRLQDQIETDKADLARPRYTNLTQENKEFEEETEKLNQLREERDKAKREYDKLQRQRNKKENRAQDINQQISQTQGDIERYEAAIANDRAQIEAGKTRTNQDNGVNQSQEEIVEIEQTREDLQAERQRLEEEIQKSSQTMSEAEGQINQIDKDIDWTGRKVKENEDIRLPAMKGFTQQAQQKKAELEEIEQELISVSQERESLENQLQQITQAKKNKINAQKWLDYIDSFIGNDDLQELDRLQHIPFTEKGKPQKQKATDELKRISQLYTEHRQGTGYHADQDNGVWKDAYTVLHYRAMEQAKKHQVADSTLSREQFDSDNEYFYQESLNKLKEEREFYRKIYEEEDQTIRQNQEQVERLQELQNREKELQNAKKQKTTELNIAQDNVTGLQEVESEIQTDKTRLAQLQQQRAEQQHIYDDAKKIQEESLQRQAEIDRMIAEAETREQQAPPATPATTQEKPSAPVSSGQAGEESPVVQNANQQLESLQNEEQQLTDKLAQITEEKNNIEKITQDINDILSKDVSVKTQKEAYNKAQFALIKASTISAERFDDRAPEDKNSSEWIKWFERNKETIQQEKMAWLEYYKAMEEFESHGGETASKIANRRRLQPSDAVKHTREDWGFTSPEDLKQQLEADLQANKELLSSYEQQAQEIQNRIDNIQQQKEQLKVSNAPLSSSGAETASGVQEEGNEAGDAASKMQALAQAKKEALEANKQLAESANTTQKAIQNESSAGDFNTLILALTEIYELLSQLPQSFDEFKGFDLTGFTEPLNTLSQTIQQLPKEGFNISLGDSFDNLASRIDEVLNKVQELTSEAKTAEIESNIAQKYDEQIKQLKADAEEAKRVIEELKRTKQDVVRDEYDPRLDSSSEQYAPKEVGREIATRTKRNPATDVDALIKEYGNLKRAQEALFTISSVDEYSVALEKREEILQRILELEQKVALSDVGQAQIDNLLMGYGDDASSNFSALSEARNTAQKSSIGQLAKEYVDQQKAEIKALADSLSSIDIIPKEAQSNWSKSRKEEYNQIAEGAQAASQAIETLNANLAAMEANGASPEVLKTFLQLKESTAQMVKDTQDESNVFGESIEAASTRLLDRLSNIETRLQVIKRDSGKLINVDPALAGALETIEKHLNKIQDLKNTVSNDPLQAINPQFTRSANSYLAQMEGKGKSKSVVEGLEQTSDRSQADFSRMTTNYGKYASALKKLFDDMSKGAGASLKNLEKDLVRVDELATRLTGSTGLARDNLLTGELNSKAAPKVADAQAEAASKASIAYEAMLTKIESKAESAQSKISSIFGEEGITKGLESGFVEGTVEGFDKFVNSANQAEEALQHLQEIQNIIKDDKTWLTQKENITDYQQTMTELKSSLDEVAQKAGDFKIVDDLDVQKLRASTTQFIRDNPALSAEDISQLEGFIDQLQGKINSVTFDNLKAGIERVKQQAIEAGRTGDTFFSMLTQRFKSLGAYLLSFVSFYRVIGVFKDGINIIHELDDALTEMQKVSDESLSSLREYQKSTFDTANQIGTTAAQLQTSTADWMRLGEDLQTASQSAQTANVLFNVSEFDNINDATTALVAMSAAYADAEEGIDKMDIVDRLNLIGNNYAIATDELATALQDGAAALQTAGNDLDEAIALTTAGEIKLPEYVVTHI